MKSPFLVGFGLFWWLERNVGFSEAVLLFSSVPVLFIEESWMERISQEAKERHERKPLQQDGVAERLLFLKGSVKWDDPAVISAAGNCMVFVRFACPLWPMCSHPLCFPLSLLSCSFLFSSTFVHEAQARDACYPFDIFSAQVVLARLWNRSSCNTGPPQQVSCPASVLSVHLKGIVCCSAMAAAPASQKPLQFASCDPDSQGVEGLDSLSHGKCSGSSLPSAFPRLDPSSTKPLNGVCWAAVCFSLPSCQHDKKCPCDTDGSFLKKCQQYQADLVVLIFSIHGEC